MSVDVKKIVPFWAIKNGIHNSIHCNVYHFTNGTHAIVRFEIHTGVASMLQG